MNIKTSTGGASQFFSSRENTRKVISVYKIRTVIKIYNNPAKPENLLWRKNS
jgi:hypothetical protein